MKEYVIHTQSDGRRVWSGDIVRGSREVVDAGEAHARIGRLEEALERLVNAPALGVVPPYMSSAFAQGREVLDEE